MKQCKGLSYAQVHDRIARYGFNEIPQKRTNVVRKFVQWLFSPIALMLLVAAILSLFVGRTFDFYFIVVIMAINFLVGFWQERKADCAIEKICQKLAVRVKVLREGAWQWIDARYVVPDDIVDLNMGDVIPADIKIVEAKNFHVNEAVLTGESFPKEKKADEQCFSGSFVTLGWARACVQATGARTYFGKILTSVDHSRRQSLLEKDVLRISVWLSALSMIAVVILTIIFLWRGESLIEIITLDLSLIIAGIPISLSTIMTLIISLGIVGLAQRKAIVRRLSALEDLANVNLLLSDKTGTLTRNEIMVEKIIPYGQFKEQDVITYASFTTRENDPNPINVAIRNKIAALKLNVEHKTVDFIPFDSQRKRSTAKVKFRGAEIRVRTGAVQVIQGFCNFNIAMLRQLELDVANAAEQGYRSVAVALKNHTTGDMVMSFVGLLLFSDTLENDAKDTVAFVKKNGIRIKMLSGDNYAITARIAKELDLQGGMVSRETLQKDFAQLTMEEFEKIDTFAEILPTDKHDLVQIARKKYIVAVTGDGINDLPALKAADVGIAVKNAVDALKGMADLVLLGNGISVICDAIIESRKIFARLYVYSVYRISESFRVIITISLLGIIYGTYPLLPIQLILLALLNDIPIISLAYDHVKIAPVPAKINAKARLKLSTLFGLVGILNSFLIVFLTRNIMHLDWDTIQTIFFLKLTVSGHMLIYVAHTRDRWYRFLPSSHVIWATTLTQLIATVCAYAGLFMHPISTEWILFVWMWSFFWMQVSEAMKDIAEKIQEKMKDCNNISREKTKNETSRVGV